MERQVETKGLEAAPGTPSSDSLMSSTVTSYPPTPHPSPEDATEAYLPREETSPVVAAATALQPHVSSLTSSVSGLNDAQTFEGQEEAGKEEETPLSAYQAPEVSKCAAAEQEFIERELPLFSQMASKVAQAEEAARVTELKSQEAATDASELVRIRVGCLQELEMAMECLNKADGIMTEAESLTTDAERGRRARSMEANVMQRREHVKELAKAAEKVEGMAQLRAAASEDLETQAEETHKEVFRLDKVCDDAVASAEKTLAAADERYCAFQKECISGDADAAAALFDEYTSLAERARGEVAAADATLRAAEQAGMAAEQTRAAVQQAGDDVYGLLHWAAELVGCSEALSRGTEWLAQQAEQRAVKKEREAGCVLELKVNATPPLPVAARTGGSDEDVVAVQQRYEHAKALSAVKEREADEIVEEAKRHARESAWLARQARQRAEHINRVLSDAATSYEREKAALDRVELLLVSARAATVSRVVKQWVGMMGEHVRSEE